MFYSPYDELLKLSFWNVLKCQWDSIRQYSALWNSSFTPSDFFLTLAQGALGVNRKFEHTWRADYGFSVWSSVYLRSVLS